MVFGEMKLALVFYMISQGSNNSTRSAQIMRDLLRDYFISPVGEEQAPLQYRATFRGVVINALNEADCI